MTRTALAPTPSLPPCVLAPDLWDSSDNTEAIAACRQHCPRRFACAQEALTGPKHLVSTLNGVIAGVAIPAQNEYGTSKAHKAALQRLKAIADSGRRVNAVAANPPHRSRPPSSEGDDQARTVQEAPIPSLNQTESNQPESRHETAQQRVLRLAPRTVEPRLGRDIPHGTIRCSRRGAHDRAHRKTPALPPESRGRAQVVAQQFGRHSLLGQRR